MNTENKIQILPDFIANQIAAGEVVQRPESVIKELVENSIDAGATSIAVFISEAGKNLIQVVDNGTGMSKEDLMLAPVRHATSKIRTSQDLEEIKTFGFRGEAIPSISSVSLLEIRSKRENDLHGWKLISEPLKEFVVEPITMETGTQIFVRNLFYNVPARRKFLKSNPTEQKYIYETIQKIALAHPDKRFIFYDNNSLVFDVKPEPLKERINSLLKLHSSDEPDYGLLVVDTTINNIRIWGFVGQPQLARKSNFIQYFFLNKRTINSRNLSYAVYSTFEHLIEKNLKPFFILNLELDYKTVDVNVHPQKSEVKFEDENQVFASVKKAVANALNLDKMLPNSSENHTNNDPNANSYEAVNYIDGSGKQDTVLVDKVTGEIINNKNYNNLRYDKLIGRDYPKQTDYKNYNKDRHGIDPNDYPSARLTQSINALFGKADQIREEINQKNNFNSETKNDACGVQTVENNDKLFTNELMSENRFNNMWQFHFKYIFVQTETGLIAIDQHNAHERIIYERLIKALKIGETPKQSLLFPVNIKLSSLQMLTVREIDSELRKIGFVFEYDNEHSAITIDSQPAELEIGLVENSFIEIIEDYLQNEELKHTTKHDRIIATIACKSAIKAGQKLSQEEMTSIVVNLFECEMPHICPHGRPIIIQSLLTEWDRKFGRI